MDFSDVSARFKKKHDEQNPVVERNFEEIHALRARILGVLIRDAREANGKTQQEIAAELQVDEDTVSEWELGLASPSLAQLEVLAYTMDLPVSHFWKNKTLQTAQHERELPVPTDAYGELRDRVIGVRLAVARKDAKLSQNELGVAAGIAAETVEAYEQGQLSIPFPELTSLANAVRKSISYFVEDTGRVGVYLALQEEYKRFQELSDEMRAFVAQPVNQAFIEIAMRLSKLPLQELRTVGEKI